MFEPPKFLIKNGIRLDGRRPDEIRPMKIELGCLSRAKGSAFVQMGGTKVLAAVFGPNPVHPKHLACPESAILKCRYDMASFSVIDRKKPGPSRRSVEISKLVAEALEPLIFLEEFPGAMIEVYLEVIQADASTRVTGLIAASLALADGGLPMRDLLAAVSLGKIYDEEGNTEIVVDLFSEEDYYGLSDIPLAIMPSSETITLLQMDGQMSQDELRKGLQLGLKACKEIYELEKKALKSKYSPK
jgi:exosome complex component RRP41